MSSNSVASDAARFCALALTTVTHQHAATISASLRIDPSFRNLSVDIHSAPGFEGQALDEPRGPVSSDIHGHVRLTWQPLTVDDDLVMAYEGHRPAVVRCGNSLISNADADAAGA